MMQLGIIISLLSSFSNIGHLYVLLPLIVLIFVTEVFVDWIKHGFITKFNGISPAEYKKYSLVLAKDVVSGSSALVSNS